MSLRGLSPTLCTQSRLTAEVLAATEVPCAETVTWSAGTPFTVRVRGGSLGAAATVSITGALSGSNQTEAVVVAAGAAGLAFTEKRWTTITQVDCSTSTTGTISVEAVTDGGELAYVTTSVGEFYGRLRPRRLRLAVEEQGSEKQERWVLYTTASGVRVLDRIVADGATYDVHNVYPVYGRRAVHHYEIELTRTG